MNSYKPGWLAVDRPRIATRVAIAILRAMTGALNWITGIVIRSTTKRAFDPDAARLTAIRAMTTMARRNPWAEHRENDFV